MSSEADGKANSGGGQAGRGRGDRGKDDRRKPKVDSAAILRERVRVQAALAEEIEFNREAKAAALAGEAEKRQLRKRKGRSSTALTRARVGAIGDDNVGATVLG